MDIKNKLTVTRGEERGGNGGKVGDGASQGTCIKWTKTTGWGLTVGAGVWGSAGESNTEKCGTNMIELQ